VNPKDARSFGKDIWARILQTAAPKLVIAMDQTDAEPAVTGILRLKYEPEDTVLEREIGWRTNSDTMMIVRSRGFPSCRLVPLPHLSRYKIIDRPKSSDALKAVFEPWWRV